MQHKPATRKARIATATLVVLALVAFAAPTVAAENEPEVQDDGSVTMGACVGVNPWRVPPDYYVDVESCLDPF